MERANEDLLVVDKLTHPEMTAISSVCFHCQQAAEKFLKAYLIANHIEIAYSIKELVERKLKDRLKD